MFAGGGGPVGTPTLTEVLLEIFRQLYLTDSSFFNQLIQRFTPGSELSFRLALTTDVGSRRCTGPVHLLHPDSTRAELPTQSFFDVFALIDIDSSNPIVHTFRSDTSRPPTAGGRPIDIASPSATAVPEP